MYSQKVSSLAIGQVRTFQKWIMWFFGGIPGDIHHQSMVKVGNSHEFETQLIKYMTALFFNMEEIPWSTKGCLMKLDVTWWLILMVEGILTWESTKW